MLQVSDNEIKNRISFDNPWWKSHAVAEYIRDWPHRFYFEPLFKLIAENSIQRAVVLMGPRRVGKTVLLTQTIQRLIDDGTPPQNIFFVSIDTPTYTGLSLEGLLHMFMEIHGHATGSHLYVIYDEIQYFPDWERHLKSLVDSFPRIRFVVSGSAAAALKLKSAESGAGRFTEFLLPPLTFTEFIRFSGWADVVDHENYDESIQETNAAFIDYLNFGGFPEAVMVPTVRQEMDRYIANDIVDKVLLRDLPSLYGIPDTQELKRFFTTIAYNTGMEVSYEGLSKSSGIAKNTIRKYLDYLEAAFLIHRHHRIDQNAQRFKRVTHFKVYLVNASIRAALFGPVSDDSEAMGRLAETAYIGQIASTKFADSMFYARWAKGEVDVVYVSTDRSLITASEIKWSDRAYGNPQTELKSLIAFANANSLDRVTVFTRTELGKRNIDGLEIMFLPVAVECFDMPQSLIEKPFQDGIDPRTFQPFVE